MRNDSKWLFNFFDLKWFPLLFLTSVLQWQLQEIMLRVLRDFSFEHHLYILNYCHWNTEISGKFSTPLYQSAVSQNFFIAFLRWLNTLLPVKTLKSWLLYFFILHLWKNGNLLQNLGKCTYHFSLENYLFWDRVSLWIHESLWLELWILLHLSPKVLGLWAYSTVPSLKIIFCWLAVIKPAPCQQTCDYHVLTGKVVCVCVSGRKHYNSFELALLSIQNTKI